MSKFIADLHIHSPYSRATSKNGTLENYALSSKIKGVNLVSTGDFCHPKWFSIIKNTLVDTGRGIFRFKEKMPVIKGIDSNDVNFILSTEISSIYKKNGKVRKIHSLIFAPDLEIAEKISLKLSRIGNISSDGRPILGLDVKNLLEIVLECSEDAFLVPAHIWTPWFSIMGDKSGFDSVEEAFEDLSPHIFALETGLSSDPEMNWRLSSLDKYTLISNSDAHSPAKVAREANIFDTELSYYAVRDALKTRKGFLGTVEFFPEEGKYHFDGHRACGISLDPEETQKLIDDLCPVCGKKLTIGVMHRVEELADRKRGYKPDNAANFVSLIPLSEILSEITGSGENTKIVNEIYERIINKYESELALLMDVPVEDIKNSFGGILSEAIGRMRSGNVRRVAGYDGEFGRIFLFDENEIDRFSNENFLFARKITKRKSVTPKLYEIKKRIKDVNELEKNSVYSGEQEEIINAKPYIRVISGPGTGKTHTLVSRIKKIIESGVNPSQILTLTFTNKTRIELKERIKNALPECYKYIAIHTFHSLGYSVLKENNTLGKLITDIEAAEILIKLCNFTKSDSEHAFKALQFFRQTGDTHPKYNDLPVNEIIRKYIDYKNENNLMDMDDLIITPPAFLNRDISKIPYNYLFIDEFQDINKIQLEFCEPYFRKAADVFIIGDPDQAIYSWRGSDPKIFSDIKNNINQLQAFSLSFSYRCPQKIIRAAVNLISNNTDRIDYKLVSVNSEIGDIYHYKAINENNEAKFISGKIKELVGSFSLSGEESSSEYNFAFSDIAILARNRFVFRSIEKALIEQGIPFSSGEKSFFESSYAIELFNFFYEIKDKKDNHQLKFKDFNIDSNPDGKNIIDIINPIIYSNKNILKWEYDIFIDASETAKSINEFINFIEIALNNRCSYPETQNVSLLTLHGAKGLEFPVVFIAGLEEGILPYSLKKDVNTNIEEERRLFYVGLTRSSKMVYLTSSSSRFIYGDSISLKPSRFIREMKSDLIEITDKKIKSGKNTKPQQLDLFG